MRARGRMPVLLPHCAIKNLTALKSPISLIPKPLMTKKSKTIITVIAIILILAAGGLALYFYLSGQDPFIKIQYVLTKSEDLIISTGEEIIVAVTDLGCCLPACMHTTQEQCASTGGAWSDTACGQAVECRMGCCAPECEQKIRLRCDDPDQTFHEASCDEVHACIETCCVPLCVELANGDCKVQGGTSEPGRCEDISACELGCCLPFVKQMTEHECAVSGGSNWQAGECIGYSAFLHTEKILQLSSGQLSSGSAGDYAHYDFKLDAGTCEPNISGQWQGNWVWTKTRYYTGQAPVVVTTNGDVSFIPDSKNEFIFEMPDNTTVRSAINDMVMSAAFTPSDEIGQVRAEAQIMEGGGTWCFE